MGDAHGNACVYQCLVKHCRFCLYTPSGWCRMQCFSWCMLQGCIVRALMHAEVACVPQTVCLSLPCMRAHGQPACQAMHLKQDLYNAAVDCCCSAIFCQLYTAARHTATRHSHIFRVQRRRTAEDELNMRTVYTEGDLISVSAFEPILALCCQQALQHHSMSVNLSCTSSRAIHLMQADAV